MNTKKNFLMLIGSILLLFGCNQNINLYSESSESSTLDQDDQHTFFKPIAGFLSMAKSSGGYYFFSGTDDHFLYFIDKKTMKPIVLCNKPDCLHSDEPDPVKIAGCNAFFMRPEEMIYYDSYLYILESNASDIVRVSLDGTSRKVLYRFKELPQYATIHRGYFYYSTSDNGTVDGNESNTKTKCKFMRLGLANPGKGPELIYEYDGIHAWIPSIVGYKEYVLFGTSSYNDSTMQEHASMLLRYDIQSKSISEIGKDIGGYSINGNKIVFTWKNRIYSCNFDGAERKLLEQVNGDLYSDKNYILADMLRDENGNNVDRRLNVFGTDGNMVSSIDLSGVGRKRMYGGDGDYLFIPERGSRKNRFGDIRALWVIDRHKLADGTARPVKIFEYIPKVEDKGVITRIE